MALSTVITGRKTSVSMLLLALVAGTVLRFMLAPQHGHDGDFVTIRRWTESAARLGMIRSYEEQIDPAATLPMYGPAAMAVLTLNGRAYLAIAGERAFTLPSEDVAMKIPSILADIAIILLLWALLRRQKPALRLFAAALYAFHPAVVYLSGVWVQLDTVAVALALAAFAAADRSRWGAAGICIVLACSVKLQTALLVPPLALMALCAGRRPALRGLTAVVLTCGALMLPFALTGHMSSLLRTLDVATVLGESRISWNAFNLWFALFGEASWDMPANGAALGIVTFGQIGWTFCIGVSAMLLLRLMRSGCQTADAVACAGLLMLSAFVLLPEMHERYLFPAIVLLIPFALRSRFHAAIYGAVSLVFFCNLLTVVPFARSDLLLTTSGVFPRMLSAALVAAWAMAVLLLSIPGIIGIAHERLRRSY